MPNTVLIPVEFNVVAPMAPTITIEGDNAIDVVVGRTTEYDVTFTRGQPPITEAQLQNARLIFYTDSGRSDQIPEDDANRDYMYTWRDIDMAAGTCVLRVITATTVTVRRLYLNVSIEQGADA